MGSGGSKTEHPIFSADTPVHFSQAVLNGLQDSPETDATRALASEYHSHHRRNQQLTQLRDSGAASFSSTLDEYTTHPPSIVSPTPSPTDIGSGAVAQTGIFYHLSSPFYQDHTTPTTKAAEVADGSRIEVDPSLSYHSVMEEVEKLRRKLDARKKVEKPSPEVERAREGLVKCLRINDRRPLDCWQEREDFERAVGKMEKAFIAGTGQ